MMNQTEGVTVEMKKILTYIVLRDKDSQELKCTNIDELCQ